MSDVVQFSRSGNITVLSIDNPPVNAIGHAVRQGLIVGMAQVAADRSIESVVIACVGRTFVAGADIAELGHSFAEPDFKAVLSSLENAHCPVVAAIHGTALGGGLELAMACDYRVATPTAQCGLPEVHLGIIPGAGGTQRLPRLVGVETALRMITTGKPIAAAEAAELGLIDAIIEDDLLAGALAFARDVVSRGGAKRRTRDITDHVDSVSPSMFTTAREATRAQAKGRVAPLRAIDAIEASTQLSFDESLGREAKIFAECVSSAQSEALRHLFFAERTCGKIDDITDDTAVKTIASAGVLGAGTMGGGIAMNFANAGIPVSLLDNSAESLQRGLATIKKNYDRMAEKGRLTPQEVAERMKLIRPVTGYAALAAVDIVIEAVFEDMDLKKQVFSELNDVINRDAILATNTSMLDVGEIAAQTDRPDKVIGLHFFSPANVMKLVEVVRCDATSTETIATAMTLVKKLRKVGVLVKVCDGFVGNRMVFPYVREACFLLEEGALPQQVDAALQNFGFAMGPHAMCDMAGQDVSWLIRKRQAASRPAKVRYSAIQDRICEMNRFGLKTGAGIYQYKKGSRTPIPDPMIEAIVVDESSSLDIERREISEQEIVERCVLALINEGAKILDDGIARRASDIDVVYIYGFGFPSYRGGPMHYADSLGLKTVYDRIRQFAKKEPRLWKPSRLLKRLAESGGRFTDV